MSYSYLLFKQIYRSKAVIVATTILFLGVVGLYIVNAIDGSDFRADMQSYLHHDQETLAFYQEELENPHISEENRIMFEEAIIEVEENISWGQHILEAIDQNDFSEALVYFNKMIDRNLDIHKETNGELFPEEAIDDFMMTRHVNNRLIELNAEPDTLHFEKFGATFTYRVMESLFPTLFMLIASLILSEAFFRSFRGGINIDVLLPKKFTRLLMKKLSFMAGVTVAFYFGILVFSFFLASIFNGTGSFHYPIVNNGSPIFETMPLWNVMMKTFILQVLAIFNLVLIVAFAAVLTKNKMATLMIAILITVGFPMTHEFISSLHPFLHLSPFTYFLGGDVAAGFLAERFNNGRIDFISGVIVLVVFASIITFILCIHAYMVEKRQLITSKKVGQVGEINTNN
ncbi:hypothetical protein [Shouchella clausii]|uniref:hypothetical protein n=1 Tax=Shouchella clausii TaxID=79880 RepID=UPI002147C870|nr:hypothetical protein [Shouchella clausii]MCR1288364.1 hypothetical protein [Shouchella clausii]